MAAGSEAAVRTDRSQPRFAPRRRQDDVIVVELAEETLAYDRRTHAAHCLNATTATVWRHCDGERSVPEIAAVLELERGVPATSNAVWLALDQLRAARLLDEDGGRSLPPITRREVLTALAAAGVIAALPALKSIVAPDAAAAASGVNSGSGAPGTIDGSQPGGWGAYTSARGAIAHVVSCSGGDAFASATQPGSVALSVACLASAASSSGGPSGGPAAAMSILPGPPQGSVFTIAISGGTAIGAPPNSAITSGIAIAVTSLSSGGYAISINGTSYTAGTAPPTLAAALTLAGIPPWAFQSAVVSALQSVAAAIYQAAKNGGSLVPLP